MDMPEDEDWLPRIDVVVVVLLAAVAIVLVGGLVAAVGLPVSGSTLSGQAAPWRQRLGAFGSGVGVQQGILLVGAALLVRWQAWRKEGITWPPVAVSVLGFVVALGAVAESINVLWGPSPGLEFSRRFTSVTFFAAAAALAGLAVWLVSGLFSVVEEAEEIPEPTSPQ
jgi:hypothetical protein